MTSQDKLSVSGYGYLVQSGEQAQKLASYIKAYKASPCWVFFMDSEPPAETFGKTFMYAGDEKALLLQRFDCSLWALQMDGKLG